MSSKKFEAPVLSHGLLTFSGVWLTVSLLDWITRRGQTASSDIKEHVCQLLQNDHWTSNLELSLQRSIIALS